MPAASDFITVLLKGEPPDREHRALRGLKQQPMTEIRRKSPCPPFFCPYDQEREGPIAREPSAHGPDPWGWEAEVGGVAARHMTARRRDWLLFSLMATSNRRADPIERSAATSLLIPSKLVSADPVSIRQQ